MSPKPEPNPEHAVAEMPMDVENGCDAGKGASEANGSEPSVDETTPLTGWRQKLQEVSLPEANSSIKVPSMDAPWWKKLFAFTGLGLLVAVGYMDPGNWSTDIAGGSKFGYTLLCVILGASMAAMFLQHLSLKLGVASDRDLAQACRDAYPKPVVYVLWVLAEIGIVACDLAEVIGSAVALNLLFGIPLWAGVLITAADVFILLLFELKNFRYLEAFIGTLILFIFGCFCYQLAIAKPDWGDVARGLVPSGEILSNPEMLYVAIGILGATVMPHNLYLHSSTVQTRAYPRTQEGRRFAIRYGTVDSSLSLLFAFFINAALLILAAAAFHYGPNPQDVADINDAYELLSPALGAKAASIIFALALLASGQNSTITATLAGQIVMEGFLHMKLRPWVRRLITRGLAIIPAAIVAAVMGPRAVGQLLVLSQVILSMQLSFAVVPLVQFTSCRKYVGKFATGWIGTIVACLLALIIAGLNVYLFVLLCMEGGIDWSSTE